MIFTDSERFILTISQIYTKELALIMICSKNGLIVGTRLKNRES